MLDRRDVLKLPGLAATAAAAPRQPVTAEVKPWNGKPALHVRGKPVYPVFYALTDCPGGRWSWEEGPRQHLRHFVEAGFRLFQVDLFLELIWPREGPLDIATAQRQIRGILEICPDAAVVIRWHLNAPGWWLQQHPDEVTRFANGGFEQIERTQPVRILMDDLRRTPRASLASRKWRKMAEEKTIALLRGLAAAPEGGALAGIHVACGVYGEWHYWGFLRNEPDTSGPMQEHFGRWRRARGLAPARVPGMEERAALDDGIFRDPARREAVISYYRCQQELVADQIIHFCGLVKKHWPRPILAGTFYGYFFSMFGRQATGGHLCLPRILAAPEVDYLSAPQAYGSLYRDLGGCGITRGLVESARLHGKLFLDEMDQSPSWQWLNNVDTAFALSELESDFAIIRRNVLESFTRGMGLWYYDFGPANVSGWWADTRLMGEIARLRRILADYHQRPYQPAGDVLFVYDTDVYYYTGTLLDSDPLTDALAVNRATGEAWRSGAAIETIHLADLPRIDLGRFRVVVLANTWLLNAEQRRLLRERVVPGRHVVFCGAPGYCDGQRLSVEFVREATGLPIRRHDGPLRMEGVKPFGPYFTVEDQPPGLVRRGGVWFASVPPLTPAGWREIFRAAGAHLYVAQDAVIHAGGGVVLLHTKEGGPHRLTLRNGRTANLELPPKSSWLFDAVTGDRLLP
jgi:hypothetical protein